MPPGKKQKHKSGKPRETRREEPATASAGVAGPSGSQEHADSGDEDTGRPELSKQTSRTNRSLRSSATTRASMICHTRTTKTRTREGAWSCSSPSPCSRVVSVFFHSFVLMLNL